MRAWYVTVCGMEAVYRGTTSKRAVYQAARDCHGAGWGKNLGEVFQKSRAVRAPQHDGDGAGFVEGTFSPTSRSRGATK